MFLDTHYYYYYVLLGNLMALHEGCRNFQVRTYGVAYVFKCWVVSLVGYTSYFHCYCSSMSILPWMFWLALIIEWPAHDCCMPLFSLAALVVPYLIWFQYVLGKYFPAFHISKIKHKQKLRYNWKRMCYKHFVKSCALCSCVFDFQSLDCGFEPWFS